MNQGITGDDTESTALMLILDVKTQWSSTHQMLHVCYYFILWNVCLTWNRYYCHATDSFAAQNKYLHAYELSEDDWKSIDLLSSWLMSCHSVTTQMFTTKILMLSTTHAIFQGLQEDIKGIICSLPATVSPCIKHSLIDMHMKLSDYYHKYDESPFYTWAACTLFILL